MIGYPSSAHLHHEKFWFIRGSVTKRQITGLPIFETRLPNTRCACKTPVFAGAVTSHKNSTFVLLIFAIASLSFKLLIPIRSAI